MKKRDLILLTVLVLMGLAALTVALLQNHGKSAAGRLQVFVDGRLYTESPLEAGKTITIQQDNGSENVIRMTKDGFYMESANWHNQDCIHQGPVTQDNWKTRVLGTHVICLPNRVDVVLVTEEYDPELPDV